MPSDTLLTIETYDGSGEVTHPDITFENDTFFLAITPYPKYNDKFENPSLYISTNGINFTPFTHNLIVPCPVYDHNNDPDVLKTDSSVAIIYLETMRPDSQNVILLETHDYKEWQKTTLIHYNLQIHEPFILSPSLVCYKDSFRVFYVKLQETPCIDYLSSSSLKTWDTNKPVELALPFTDGYRPWHVDVTKYGDHFLLLCCADKDENDHQNN